MASSVTSAGAPATSDCLLKNITVDDTHKRLVRALADKGEDAEISHQFRNLISNSSRVDFVHALLERFQLLPRFVQDVKNNEEASMYRDQGNQFFRMKNDAEALKLYTKSIAFAENGSETLGLAYANRAAVLFELKFYQQCLKDIELAYENNYPEKLHTKLQTRREKAIKSLSSQNKDRYHEPLPVIPNNDRNPLIPCASKALDIRETPELGRHVVATRGITIGEVLVVEQSAFSVLLEHKLSHCHDCLVLCYNLIPCEHCTQALYCSVECRVKAFVEYHKFECALLLTVNQMCFDDLKLLPMKIALRVRDQYTQLESYKITSTKDIYQSGRYKELHNLCAHTEQRSTNDLFTRSVTAAVIYYLIRNYSTFFPKPDNNFTDNIFKELVLLHLQTSACNFHELSELGETSEGIYEADQIGGGAFAFLSLFNHSCNPNVSRYCYGTTVVVRAIETISKGEQICDNYGQHYALTSRTKRREKLKKQYFFDCNCQPCKENWPTFLELPQSSLQELDCTQLITELMNTITKLSKACVETARQTEGGAITVLTQIKRVQPHLEVYGQMQEIMKQCFAIYGNKRRTLG